MRITIIDADLIGRKKHRFPNLACMKLSGFHKDAGDEVILKTYYEDLERFDQVYVSKVFTDTEVPDGVLDLLNARYNESPYRGVYITIARWCNQPLQKENAA